MKKTIVKITSNALVQLGRIAKDNKSESIIFSVKGGGCSGFKYLLEPTNEPATKLDEIICLKDEMKRISNIENETPLKSLIVCGHSLIHLLGTEIDWKKDIMGETFVFENPMAKSSCGCGTSFNSKGLK
tara:strand:+ start:2098 stop:2484 length:387 start_codon:yes stop_codon:yes gene_type:complete